MMIECDLCFHRCKLEEGQTGFCRARRNVDGKIISLNYGRVTSIALDPIEKKPFKHFHPGSKILSLGGFGCNLRCPFCQNYSISMANDKVFTRRLSVSDAVELAKSLMKDGNIGIAYTYNEPLINYEYVLDCSIEIKKSGLINVLVTNGIIEEEPLRKLLPMIDAYNIDLKGFSQTFYDKISGDLESVKRTIMITSKVAHVEITFLVIEGENDSDEEMDQMAKWLADIDSNIPLHINRFFPNYLWKDKSITSKETLVRLKSIAEKYLNRVSLGNIG
ncbi:MAG: AmmeMemoRadiSam system radical SAM enzyme [Firmicutes bacterium HGW-Firmicutes-20]|nr:MAG: AmmeMemoRadiSam system radical SAM enzyme [Firmicutes bacterium HGW-Firmicutes-20]PKM68987.1 MAG: AmmeMemoRadiSam system radical SAM enzyme [Firmicutes bacterium HGW-Firmicutes-19]